MKTKILGKVAITIGHAIGVFTVFSATFWLHGTPEVIDAMGASAEYGFMARNKLEVGLQFALAGCLWALGYLVFAYLKAAAADQKKDRIIKVSRGTVMTETLIAMPVLLLLTMGLLQLTLNNTAAMLTSLAAFQASRSAYVWEPETRPAYQRNGGISAGQMTERARVAAASVVAPSASSYYKDGCGTSSIFNSKLEAIASASVGIGGVAGVSVGAVKGLVGGAPLNQGQERWVGAAYDTGAFALRGPQKLYVAYCNTQASVSVGGDYITTEVTYQMKQTMPLVGIIFGKPSTRGWLNTMTRTYTLPTQINPNRVPPRSFLKLVTGFNPFSSWL